MGSLTYRIHTWLESVSNANENQVTHQRVKLGSKERTLLLSPPASLKRPTEDLYRSEMSQVQTPKKRRLHRDISSEDDAEAQEVTPRTNTSASVLDSDIPSLPSRPSSVLSGQSSPSRQLSRLRLHPKGSESKSMNMNDEDMPLALVDFVLEMQRVVKSKFVPAHLEPVISQRKRHVRSLVEFEPDVYASAHNDLQYALPSESCSLDDIVQIVAKANEAANLKQDEAGWNSLVHSPILEAVLYGRHGWGKQLAGFCPCITAGISPEYRVENIPGKKIDFVLLIDPQFDRESASAVHALWQARGTVNPTDFFPLQKRPITVSIETKRTNESLERADLQMSVWHAAQWRLLEELAGTTALDELGFLPAVFVQGHKWEFVASTYQNGRTVDFLD
ncbi:hypothetical protein F66182_3856 [Fusarium sp. NRRL 66182]|nr:hypothetical protein F66182_3856 [Fusarium sp. NRRL 66182]